MKRVLKVLIVTLLVNGCNVNKESSSLVSSLVSLSNNKDNALLVINNINNNLEDNIKEIKSFTYQASSLHLTINDNKEVEMKRELVIKVDLNMNKLNYYLNDNNELTSKTYFLTNDSLEIINELDGSKEIVNDNYLDVYKEVVSDFNSIIYNDNLNSLTQIKNDLVNVQDGLELSYKISDNYSLEFIKKMQVSVSNGDMYINHDSDALYVFNKGVLTSKEIIVLSESSLNPYVLTIETSKLDISNPF